MDSKSGAPASDDFRSYSRVEWWCSQTNKMQVTFVLDKHLHGSSRSPLSSPTDRARNGMSPLHPGSSQKKKRKRSSKPASASKSKRMEHSRDTSYSRKSSVIGVHS